MRFLAEICNPIRPIFSLFRVWIVHFFFTRNLYASGPFIYGRSEVLFLEINWLINGNRRVIFRNRKLMRKMIARSPTIESNKIADYTEIYSHKRIIESIIIFDRISDRIHLIINDSYFAGILLFVLTDVDFIFIIFFFYFFFFLFVLPPPCPRETWSFRHRPSLRIHTEVANLKTTSRYYDGRK